MMNKKISIGIIGLGHIGGALAHSLLQDPLYELSLYDLKTKVLEGKRKDLLQSAVVAGHPAPSLTLSSSYEAMRECDIIVVTAGKPRQPGMDRRDLIPINRAIVEEIGRGLRSSSAIVILVTNPVDLMAFWFLKAMEAKPHQILGMAGVLDSGRYQAAIASVLEVPAGSLEAWVLGPHNDDMVPLSSCVRHNGETLEKERVSNTQWQEIFHETRQGGGIIVELLGSGSAFYGPAEAIKKMIQAIAYDKKALLPSSVLLQGEYGFSDIFCGVPVIIGRGGVEKIVTWPLSHEEQTGFSQGASHIKELLASFSDK